MVNDGGLELTQVQPGGGRGVGKSQEVSWASISGGQGVGGGWRRNLRGVLANLIATKDPDTIVADHADDGLKKSLGALELTLLGIGNVSGTACTGRHEDASGRV
jgi:hypothetical protein